MGGLTVRSDLLESLAANDARVSEEEVVCKE